jgi:hypothetical protein
LQHLLLFWLVSMLGFGLGYVVAEQLSFHVLTLGSVPVLEASLGALTLLLVARRFAI